MDSSGLSALIACRHGADAVGGTFFVRGPHGEVATVLAITGLAEVLIEPQPMQ